MTVLDLADHVPSEISGRYYVPLADVRTEKYLVSESTEVHIQIPSPLNVFPFSLGFFNDAPELVHLQGVRLEILLGDGSGSVCQSGGRMRPSLDCVFAASDGPGYRPYTHTFIVQFYAHVEFFLRASDPVVCCAGAAVEDAPAILAYEFAYLSAAGLVGAVGYDVPFAGHPESLAAAIRT